MKTTCAFETEQSSHGVSPRESGPQRPSLPGGQGPGQARPLFPALPLVLEAVLGTSLRYLFAFFSSPFPLISFCPGCPPVSHFICSSWARKGPQFGRSLWTQLGFTE